MVERMIARLVIRYPTVPPSDIEHSVHTIHQRFSGRPICDFVPLLVEKAAKREIAERM